MYQVDSAATQVIHCTICTSSDDHPAKCCNFYYCAGPESSSLAQFWTPGIKQTVLHNLLRELKLYYCLSKPSRWNILAAAKLTSAASVATWKE